MAQSLLLDTDFLIDFLRGQGQAVAFYARHYPMLSGVVVPYRKR